jgi:PEP-CTERM motif
MEIVMPKKRRKESLRLGWVVVLCAGAAPAGAQTYVGNNFTSGSSLLGSLLTDGSSDQYPPLVILQEYSPSGPATTGAIFASAGTVNDVSFYGGGPYDFTVYALALDSTNTGKNELTFTVVGESQPIIGDATTKGVQTVAANFSVSAGDYLAFAGIGPWYPQAPNDAAGSDATYETSSEPQTYPTSFTAIPPTARQTFTVGAHGDSNATYEIVPNPFENQGRSYGIGVYYTPAAAPTAYYLKSGSLGQTNLSWSDAGGQSNWVDQNGATASPPEPSKDVYITNSTGANASGPTVVNFDATTDPQPKTLTIDSNAGGQLVELSQAANTLTSGSETIGTTGPAEHLQTGGTNNVTGTLAINAFGTYDLQGGTLNAGTIGVEGSGSFYFDGGTASFTTFNQTGGTVASGMAASLASAAAHLYFGTGSEIVSAAGSLTPSVTAGASPMVSGGATVNQSDGTNYAGALTLGLNGGVGVYNLSGGGTLKAIREMIGGDSASAGLFNQTGGTNSLENALGGDPLSVGANSLYEISGSGSELNTSGLEIRANGAFDQAQGVVEAGEIRLQGSAAYTLSGGTLKSGDDVDESEGEIVSGAFTQSGGDNTLLGNLPKPPNSPNQSVGLAIENGGLYDLQGGRLFLNTRVNSGGTFQFDGGQNLGTFTLEAGGTVTSSGAETIQAPFFQLGGSNTTTKLAVAGSVDFGSGTYDLQGGTLNAGTIGVEGVGAFNQTGGQANVTGAVNNLGTVTLGAGGTFSVGGAYTNVGITLLEGGTLQASGGILAAGGLIGGTGTLAGAVIVSGGIVQVGASPDALHIEGAYKQTGGTITFDVDPDGRGGFLESSLVFDVGNPVSITGTKIVFEFLNGASPLAFFDSGDFNLDQFFEESDGSLFSNSFNLAALFAGDTFATNMRGFDIAGFGADGAVNLLETSSVPEPSTWAMLVVGFVGLGLAGRRRGGWARWPPEGFGRQVRRSSFCSLAEASLGVEGGLRPRERHSAWAFLLFPTKVTLCIRLMGLGFGACRRLTDRTVHVSPI